MKQLRVLLLLLPVCPAMAGGWSAAGIPTQVDVERSGGFMIYGSFGNAGGCVVADRLYVKSDHPQYKQMYAAALTAFAGKYRITAYVDGCESVTWYSAASTTFNIVSAASVLMISD